MDKRPIRRKFKDNPYTLESNDGIYYVCFKNKLGFQKVVVDKNIFDIFDENERYENSRYYEYSVHIEHFDLNDEEIYNKNNLNYINEEDKILDKIYYKEIYKLFNKLSDIHKRRIIKYFYYDMTYNEIALEENCSKVAIKYSIDIALDKLKKEIKK